MIVLMDIGNSNIVIAQYDTAFQPTYRYTTDKTKSVDEYHVLFKDVMDGASAIIVSSVVPELNIIIKNMAQKYLGITPMFVGPGVKTGVKLIVDNPKEVGADLVAAAAAAIEHYGDTVILVDMGTATTFTLVEDRIIKGAAFMAGLVTQRNCLVGSASQLSQFEFKTPDKVLGTNTVEALNAGLLYGHALMIQAMAEKIRSEYQVDAPLIITGGASRFVQDLFDETVLFDQHLVLKGLLVIHEKNQR